MPLFGSIFYILLDLFWYLDIWKFAFIFCIARRVDSSSCLPQPDLYGILESERMKENRERGWRECTVDCEDGATRIHKKPERTLPAHRLGPLSRLPGNAVADPIKVFLFYSLPNAVSCFWRLFAPELRRWRVPFEHAENFRQPASNHS